MACRLSASSNAACFFCKVSASFSPTIASVLTNSKPSALALSLAASEMVTALAEDLNVSVEVLSAVEAAFPVSGTVGVVVVGVVAAGVVVVRC